MTATQLTREAIEARAKELLAKVESPVQYKVLHAAGTPNAIDGTGILAVLRDEDRYVSALVTWTGTYFLVSAGRKADLQEAASAADVAHKRDWAKYRTMKPGTWITL